MASRVVSVVSRLGALSLVSSVSTNSCRFASRDVKAWTRQNFAQRVPGRRPPAQHDNMSNDDSSMEDVEDKLNALLSMEKKKKAAIKLAKIKRQMTPSGAPERTLSWDTIEQIRFLRRERPEEWTVERLAEGFAVPPDDILRVLRSKFTPAAARKVKQDALVMARLGQQPARLPAGGPPPATLLPPGQKTLATAVAVATAASGPGAPVRPAGRTPTPRAEAGRGGGEVSGPPPRPGGGRVALAVRPDALSLATPTAVGRLAPAPSAEEDRGPGTPPEAGGGGEEVEEVEEEERWDGDVLTERELEQLMLSLKPSPAQQVGKEFFDPEGNFLYRI